MKKIYLLSAALIATAAMGQSKFGMYRDITIPEDLVPCAQTITEKEDGTISYGTSKASGTAVTLSEIKYNTSAGIEVKFAKGSDARLNPAAEATETAAARAEGEASDLRYYLHSNFNGAKVADNTTFVSKANTEDNANAKDENMWVGLEYTIPAGVTLNVNAFTFLGAFGNSFQYQFELVNANGDILWQTKAGEPFKVQSYNQAYTYGDSCHITTEHITGIHAHSFKQLESWSVTDSAYYEGKCKDELASTLIPADFKLTEGTYTLKVYYWKDGPKQWTPVEISLEGTAGSEAADAKFYRVPENGNETLAGGTSVTDVDGITLTYGNEAGEVKIAAPEGGYTFADNENFTYRAQGSANPSPNGGKTPSTGSYLVIEASQAGALTVYASVESSNKPMYVVDGADNQLAFNMNGTDYEAGSSYSGDKTLAVIKLNVVADGVYYIYVNGSKIGFYGFSFAAGASSLNAISAPEAEGAIYNLRGQRVNETVSGQLYIMNGKKFIVK